MLFRSALLPLVQTFQKQFPEKTLWCYTGFSFERDLLSGRIGDPGTLRELLSCIDVFVDGKFVENLKDPSLIFRGSSNQNIIDVPRSLAENRMVLLPGTWKRTIGSGDIHEM